MTIENRTLKRPLGEWLCRWRLLRGMTQQQLADGAGLSLWAIQHIEQGRVLDPRLGTIVRICDTLGLTLAELLTEPEPLEYS
ncbi:MAG: helix-turn-helix domain-containing protein [Gemmataceae bacterium]|nr:helix-turn-helix domain-containing protein [Gemmataceae bacterium]